MALEFALPTSESSIIKVFGVGGGGSNAVNNMYLKGIRGVEFYVCNTDIQDLQRSPIGNRLALGTKLTNGLGAGSKPEVGKNAALESIDAIREVLKKGETRMVFITAGMGGGTGTGAAPIIASLAKELGILTVGIVTTPFLFEGQWRMNLAKAGVEQMERAVDTLVIINNQNLLKVAPRGLKQRDAFIMADKVLCDAAKGISELVTNSGYINVDFADVETIMKDGGTAIMGTATFEGENRAIQAIEEALNCPLLENMDISGASGVLVNICASEELLQLSETEVVMEHVYNTAGEDARIIFGTVYDDSMQDRLSVTVIATGFNKKKEELPLPSSKFSNSPVLNYPLTHENQIQKNQPASKYRLDNFSTEMTDFPEVEEVKEHHIPKSNPVVEELQAQKITTTEPEPTVEKPIKPLPQITETTKKTSEKILQQPETEKVIAGIDKEKINLGLIALDYHNIDDLLELEKPTFLRYGISLKERKFDNSYSAFSITEDRDGRFTNLNNGNSVFKKQLD